MIEHLHLGIGAPELALTANRVAVGSFFAISGFYKLLNQERHASLVEEMKYLKIPYIRFNQWWVPSIEFTAGCGVVLGLLTPLASAGLLVIISVACACVSKETVTKCNPLTKLDAFKDWLMMPETLFIFMLSTVLLGGPGPYSLDAVVLKWLYS